MIQYVQLSTCMRSLGKFWHKIDNSQSEGLEKPTYCTNSVAIMRCTYITDWATLNKGRSDILVLIRSAYILKLGSGSWEAFPGSINLIQQILHSLPSVEGELSIKTVTRRYVLISSSMSTLQDMQRHGEHGRP